MFYWSAHICLLHFIKPFNYCTPNITIAFQSETVDPTTRFHLRRSIRYERNSMLNALANFILGYSNLRLISLRLHQPIILIVTYALIIMLAYDKLFFGTSTDLGYHWLLTNFISEHKFVPTSYDPILQVMSSYPPGSHIFAALVGFVFGSNLLALHITALISIIVVYTLIERTLQGQNLLETFVALVLFVLGAIVLRRPHLLIGNEIVYNFFYPQLFATALCLLLLRIATSLTSRLPRLVFVSVAVSVLSYTYNLSAVVFASAFVFINFCDVLVRKTDRMRSAFVLARLCVLLVLVLVIPPTFRFMIINSAWDGDISVRFSPLTIALIALATVMTALWAGTFPEKSHLASPSARFIVAASAGFAMTALIQYGAYVVLGMGSRYAVLKSGFGLATFALCLSVLLIRNIVMRSSSISLSTPRRLKGVKMTLARPMMSLLFVCAVSATVFGHITPVNFEAYTGYDRSIRDFVQRQTPTDILSNTISVNSDFNVGLNFAVALANLRLVDHIDQLRAFGYGEAPSPNPARYAFIASTQTSTFDAACQIASLGATTLIWRVCWLKR
jgi:hypothetical protein